MHSALFGQWPSKFENHCKSIIYDIECILQATIESNNSNDIVGFNSESIHSKNWLNSLFCFATEVNSCANNCILQCQMNDQVDHVIDMWLGMADHSSIECSMRSIELCQEKAF